MSFVHVAFEILHFNGGAESFGKLFDRFEEFVMASAQVGGVGVEFQIGPATRIVA